MLDGFVSEFFASGSSKTEFPGCVVMNLASFTRDEEIASRQFASQRIATKLFFELIVSCPKIKDDFSVIAFLSKLQYLSTLKK